MATTRAERAPRSTSEGTITTSGLVWGLLLGLPAGFVLQLVLGIALGPLVERWAMVAYLDWIAGRNMWFAGGPGIGIVDEANAGWHSRLNLNVGFYF